MLVSSSLPALGLSLMACLIVDRPLVLGLQVRVLSDLEARTAMEQRAQEATVELMALTSSRQAMCDAMLGAAEGVSSWRFV